MKTYNTEKRASLIAFLKEHADTPMTVDEICRGMSGSEAGKSTVYRLISRFADDGEVRRISPDGSGTYTYQYNREGCCSTHLHLKCTECGKLIHLDNSVSRKIETLLSEHKGFMVDEMRSTLFGVCRECSR